MREGAEKEFYNARGTRYVRDHATRATVYSEGRPNEKVLPYRMLAKTIIYQSLLDAYAEHDRVRERLDKMMHNPNYELYCVNPVKNRGYNLYYFRKRGNGYTKYIQVDDIQPESVRFFSGPEYRFYAEIAGIRVDGETLLQHFIDRADGRLPSLDSIIEEKGE